ncbi:MAG: hypothetical protein IJ329_03890 [Clostridia bacterium]|nr:hypothetical protein [Clostridia bacterium]
MTMGLRAWRRVKNILRFLLCLLSVGYGMIVALHIPQMIEFHLLLKTLFFAGGLCVSVLIILTIISFITRILKKELAGIDLLSWIFNLIGTLLLFLATERWVFLIIGIIIALLQIVVLLDFEKIF